MSARTARLPRALLAAALVLAALPAAALEARRVEQDGVGYVVAEVDLARDALELLWRRPDDGEPFGTLGEVENWARQHGRRLAFATNAGIYAPGQVPLGLFVEDGRTRVPLNTAHGAGNFFMRPNGVFAVYGRDRARVSSTAAWAAHPGAPRIATQSGPLLLQGGRINPRFAATSDSRHIRSGVCAPQPQRVLFAISESPVNFHAFARVFRDRLGCRDALYLDGTISQLYLAGQPYVGASRWLGRPFAGIFAVLEPR